MEGDGFSDCYDGGSTKYWIYLKKKIRISLYFIVYFNKTWLPCIYAFEDCTVCFKIHIQGFFFFETGNKLKTRILINLKQRRNIVNISNKQKQRIQCSKMYSKCYAENM